MAILFLALMMINPDGSTEAPEPDGVAWLARGVAEQRQFHLAAAAEAIRKALSLLDPAQDPLAYAYATANWGTVLAGQGELARAEPVLRRSIYLLEHAAANHSDIDAARRNLAMVLVRDGRGGEAEPILTQLAGGGQPASRAALGELYVAQGRWAEAEQILRVAVDCLRHDENLLMLAGALRLLSTVKAARGSWSAALNDLTEALSIMESATVEAPGVRNAWLAQRNAILRHLHRKKNSKP